MLIAEELTKLGKKIDDAKQKISTLNGRKAELLERLLKDYDVKDIDEAEKLLDKMDEELKATSQSIEEQFKDLKEKFPSFFKELG